MHPPPPTRAALVAADLNLSYPPGWIVEHGPDGEIFLDDDRGRSRVALNLLPPRPGGTLPPEQVLGLALLDQVERFHAETSAATGNRVTWCRGVTVTEGIAIGFLQAVVRKGALDVLATMVCPAEALGEFEPVWLDLLRQLDIDPARDEQALPDGWPEVA